MDDPAAILEGLTEQQRIAAAHLDGPALVLAGPGSGKTRVITRRVAHLIANGIPAWSILALTFTNKAAGEMRERIEQIVPPEVPGRRGLTVTTFHALCARLLRMYADDAGVPPTYTIYDSADQRSAIKEALKRAEMSAKNWTPAAVHGHISHAKNQLIDAAEYERQASDFYTKTIAKAYRKYQEILKDAGALDFDDLLMKVATLLREDERVRSELQERYQYLLIDEYQDTNHVQFVIAHTIASEHANIFVVGDPDQSIYAWRGANIRNILDFETHYPDATIIPLGENFRSTEHIVLAADRLIRHNTQRKHKDLFTANEAGEKPQVIRCRDEHHEARIIVDELRHRHDEHGVAWKEMAVMYRINALSRVVEEELRRAGIPYIIARGTAFFERAEIKDALAYIRVLANPSDEISLRRIINTPARGIGKTTIERLELFAYSNSVSLFEAARRAGAIDGLGERVTQAVLRFVKMMTTWRERAGFPEGDEGNERETASVMMFAHHPEEVGDLADLVEMVIRESGLEDAYRKSKAEEDVERLANLEELVNSAADFVAPLELGGEPSPAQEVTAWLESIALVSDADMIDPELGAVTLMTLHAAKGLEFPVVCMAGLEEGLLPHFNASNSEAEIEEERRLCFVGITRAMRHLTLTHAVHRATRGISERRMPSHFLRELPEEHVTTIDQADEGWTDPYASETGYERDEFSSAHGHDAVFMDLHVGSKVRHPQFGIGRIQSMEKRRDFTRSKINFAGVGVKTLILEYARLEVIESQ